MLLQALQTVGLCQRAGAICKMKEGKLKKIEGPCFSHEIESLRSLVRYRVAGFGGEIDR